MSVWGKVKGRRRAFLSLLLDGVSPKEACDKIWPSVSDVHGHITRVMSDPEFKRTRERLSDYQNDREALMSTCQRILSDDSYQPSFRIAAMRLLASIRGYIDSGLDGGRRSYATKTLRPSVKPIEESQLLAKMAELGKKANNGHIEKPS